MAVLSVARGKMMKTMVLCTVYMYHVCVYVYYSVCVRVCIVLTSMFKHECVMYVLPHVVRLIYFYSAFESSLGCVWRCSSQAKGRDRCGEGQK